MTYGLDRMNPGPSLNPPEPPADAMPCPSFEAAADYSTTCICGYDVDAHDELPEADDE